MPDTRDELDRLIAKRDALLNHFAFIVNADTDLNAEEKADTIDCAEQALGDAFFRLIDPLEAELDEHVAIVRQRQDAADLADLRARS